MFELHAVFSQESQVQVWRSWGSSYLLTQIKISGHSGHGGLLWRIFLRNTSLSCSSRCIRILSCKVCFSPFRSRFAFSWFLLPNFFLKYLLQLIDLLIIRSSHLSKLYTKVEIWTSIKGQGFEIRNVQLILLYLPGRWPETLSYFQQ